MYAYNPRKKSFPLLEKSMVGSDRWDILNSILKEMDIKKNEGPKQHWMIIGPRGIGKSHLMALLYHKVKEDQKLSKKWVPILFPEELKLAGSLHQILERILNEIIWEIEEKESSISAELKQRIENIKRLPAQERTGIFFDLISWFYKETGKHTLLIAENLQHLLGKKIPLIEQKKLRAFLQTSEALLIIGSATTVFDALHDHSHPFYHFFHNRRLDDLDFEDMKTLIHDILSQRQQPGLKRKVSDGNARLKAFYSFTGGNPRMAVFLADILSTEVPGEMLELMDRILDELTPYFESIFQGIPGCFEEVINTLAAFEPAQSPSEIARHLEMPHASTRNYLKQLKDDGYVRIAFSKGRSNYYCLNEYLYRTWFQMRDSSHRKESLWLIELLLMLYSREYIAEEKNRLEACIGAEPGSLNYKKLIDQVVRYMDSYPAYCNVIEWCMDSLVMNDKKENRMQKQEMTLKKEIFADIKKQQYEKAIGRCKKVLEINPKKSCFYDLWGECLRGLGRHDEAIEKCKKILEINPKSETAYHLWGSCLFEQEDYEEAINKFKEVIKLNPQWEIAYGAWGVCLEALGRFEEAIEKFKKAIELNPKSERAYWAWGDCLRKQRRPDEAIGKFKEAIELNQNSASGYMGWGECLQLQNHYNEAIEKFKKAIELNPNYDQAYGAWGACLQDLGRNEEALALIEANVKDSKSCSTIHYYANCLVQAKRYDDALEQFEKLIAMEPECPGVYEYYGQLMEKRKDKVSALSAYLSQIKLFFDGPDPDYGIQEIYSENIAPLLSKLKPSKYLEQFFESGKKKRYDLKLIILLTLLAQYDIIREHARDIFAQYPDKKGKEKREFELFIFTIKLSAWLNLIDENLNDALKSTELYIEYIKALQAIKEKENEVLNFSLDLFTLQIKYNIKAGNVRNLLKRMADEEEIPFNNVIFKVWMCLSEPDSVEAQRYLNEKPIAVVVEQLKERVKPQKRAKKKNTLTKKSQRRGKGIRGIGNRQECC